MNKKKILLMCTLLVFMLAALLAAVSCKTSTVQFTFETNGGSSVETTVVEIGKDYTLPTTSKDGYAFDGWFTSADFSGEAVTSVKAETDMTFYAKWTEQLSLTLDVGDGTLSENVLYLANGENIYQKVQSYKPVLDGCDFNCWLTSDGQELSQTAVISADTILTARYSVNYIVKIYLQSATNLTSYESDSDVVDSGFVGETVSLQIIKQGFTEVTKDDSVAEKKLSANSSENEFKLYFDRDTYKVVFHSNYPNGSTDETFEQNVLYGTAAIIASDKYTVFGYCLAGWSTSVGGAVEFSSNYADSMLYYKSQKVVAEDSVSPVSNLDLYAVWEKAYTDMFGGEDEIYVIGNNVYLLRGGVFFKGSCDDDGEFVFETDDETVQLEGKLKDDGTFVYADYDRAVTYTLYESGSGFDDSVTLIFDKIDGFTYAEQVGSLSGTLDSIGVFEPLGNDNYTLTFTGGQNKGEVITVKLSTQLDDNGITKNAFQIRNEEQYGWGTLYRFVLVDGVMNYYSSAYTIALDGYDTAEYYSGSSYSQYSYSQIENTESEDILVSLLNQSSGKEALRFCVMTQQLSDGTSMYGYLVYNSTLDATFTSDAGDTIVLDGIYRATYTKNGVVVAENAQYSVSSSSLGGYILAFTVGTQNYLVRVYTKTSTVIDGDESQSVTKYILEEKTEKYKEYYYYNESKQNSPIFTFDEEDGKLSVYGKTSSGYEKILYGSYSVDQATGLYCFTTEQSYEVELTTTNVDLTDVTEFIFGADVADDYNVVYLYSVTQNGTTTEYGKQYTSDSGATLTLVAGFAIYKNGITTSVGTYNISESLLTVTLANDTYLYMELEDSTFTILDILPVTAYELVSYTRKENVTLVLDGKGSAVYTESATDENNTSLTSSGTITETEETSLTGATIYLFTSDEIAFKYILLYSSSYVYFARYDEELASTYTMATESGKATLQLDGFGFKAVFTNAFGKTFEGSYSFSSENVITFVISSGSIDFDVNGNVITMRDGLDGTYSLISNYTSNGQYAELDGYGNLKVYKTDSDGNKEYICTDGTYAKEGDLYVFKYTEGNTEITYSGKFSSSLFIIKEEKIAITYVVEKDWSVLILDGCGNAVKYDAEGNSETGYYQIVTDEYLYYVNSKSTNACIYSYDVENGVAKSITTDIKSSTYYYNSDFDSLVFSRYGTMSFNGGEISYYYSIDDNDDVWVYHFDETDDAANKYGFVEEKFGEFDKSHEFNGKLYYKNDGTYITFERGNADEYPILSTEDETTVTYKLQNLMFAPSGSAEFESVKGSIVMVDGDGEAQTLTCYVYREKDENGDYFMYIYVGSYRFDITVDYNGSANQYTISSMKYIQSMPSYMYLYYLYRYASILGSITYASYYVQNSIGVLYITYEYDASGELSTSYFSGAFGESSEMYDLNGEIISVENVTEYSVASTSGGYLLTVEFTGDDGCQYRIYAGLIYVDVFSTYGYQLIALTRVETVTDSTDPENIYEFTAERIIASDYASYYSSYAVGNYWSVSLKLNGEEISYDTAYTRDDIYSLYFIVHDTDEETGLITATTSLVVELAVDDESEAVVPLLTEVNVSESAMTTRYASDGESYVDIDVDNNVVIIYIAGSTEDESDTKYLVNSSTYDESTKTYTLTVGYTTVKTFTVTVNGDTVTITETTEEESSLES